MIRVDGSLPSPADIDAVLALLPDLERPEFSSARRPWFGGDPEVRRIHETLYRHGFILGFDWPSWRAEAERYQREPDALARAPLVDLCKLLTSHVRLDRFVGGHFESVVQSGQLAAILRRLQAIREEGAQERG